VEDAVFRVALPERGGQQGDGLTVAGPDVAADPREEERAAGVEPGRTSLFVAIESALGALSAYDIAVASPRVIGIALGAEDYCADMRVQRTAHGQELLFARQCIVTAARAAKVAAVDTVFSDINDMETFEKEVEFIKMLGFDGKSVINPRQIKPVHRIFAPAEADIEKAWQIVAAARAAEKAGSGVVSLNGRMVDRPVVLRAQRILDMARATHMLEDYEEARGK
jgi:citrate lyase subunit beta/citryl-CoA lyase